MSPLLIRELLALGPIAPILRSGYAAHFTIKKDVINTVYCTKDKKLTDYEALLISDPLD